MQTQQLYNNEFIYKTGINTMTIIICIHAYELAKLYTLSIVLYTCSSINAHILLYTHTYIHTYIHIYMYMYTIHV